MSSIFRTRQAPSPTGYLHLGTARTVLFTKLLTHINNGEWYLRLEDTDRTRLQPHAAKLLLEALYELGLEAKEGIKLEKSIQSKNNQTYSQFYNIYEEGDFGPYIQSERLALYHQHAQNLIDKELAYWSFLTEGEINELQEIKRINKQPINYHKFCLEKSGEKNLKLSVAEGLNRSEKPTLRYKLQRDKSLFFEDKLLGKTEFDLNLEEDFTILKSDGFPVYHLAHLIDDYLMQTTLVIRAQEWLPSAAKHVTMFKDYWGKAPDYLHLPVILGETGNKKMSKRDGNVNMQDYLDKGYLPEAIVNYLAFLGWNPGTEKELYLGKEDW